MTGAIEVFREKVKANIETGKTATEEFFKIVSSLVEDYQRDLRFFCNQMCDDFANKLAAQGEDVNEEEEEIDEDQAMLEEQLIDKE